MFFTPEEHFIETWELNLLIDDKGANSLADFGLDRAFRIQIRMWPHEVMTLWYPSLEMLLGSAPYSTPLDIWSIGTISPELATKKPLFVGDSETNCSGFSKIWKLLTTRFGWIKNIFPKRKPGILKSCQESGWNSPDWLSKMLVYDSAKQIYGKVTLKHPYVDDLDTQIEV